MKVISVLVSTLLLAACANNPQGGAMIGGAAGGATGAAVGYGVGGRDGAIIGGAIGGAAGAGVGSNASQSRQPAETTTQPVYRKRGHDEDKHRKHRKGGRDDDDHDRRDD